MTREEQIQRLEDRLDDLPSYDHPAAERIQDQIEKLKAGKLVEREARDD